MFERFRRKKQEELPILLEEEINLSKEEIAVLKEKAETMDESTLQKHSKHYSDDGLWNKIKKFSKKAGSSAVYAVLLLYYVLQKDEVPAKNKAIIIGALGYFILPLDLIPDLAAVVGYSDDIGALLAALWQVSMYIDADVKNQAKEKLKDWFGDNVDTSEIDNKLA
ncbi:YkvA family protein [Lysinibacillus telephonicus]|uniref:YkvA family protein n=1 Tax=Lysinibacillus telephonicus TaxID=1714840 RepID=UPI003D153D36